MWTSGRPVRGSRPQHPTDRLCAAVSHPRPPHHRRGPHLPPLPGGGRHRQHALEDLL